MTIPSCFWIPYRRNIIKTMANFVQNIHFVTVLIDVLTFILVSDSSLNRVMTILKKMIWIYFSKFEYSISPNNSRQPCLPINGPLYHQYGHPGRNGWDDVMNVSGKYSALDTSSVVKKGRGLSLFIFYWYLTRDIYDNIVIWICRISHRCIRI